MGIGCRGSLKLGREHVTPVSVHLRLGREHVTRQVCPKTGRKQMTPMSVHLRLAGNR